jgi:hypothetical protein
MKSENNSEIRKQQLLFTASLLSVVVAVFLFTSAFFGQLKQKLPGLIMPEKINRYLNLL